METTKDIFVQVYEKVLAKCKDLIQDVENFGLIIAASIQEVKDSCKELHGFEKKDLVEDIVIKIIETMPIEDEVKEKLEAMAAAVMGQYIDILFAAAKGYLMISAIKEEIAELQTKCYAGCGRKKTKKIKKGVPKPKAIKATPEDAVNMIYDRIRETIVNKKVTLSNVMIIVSSAMKIMEEFTNLTGQEKKNIVIAAVKRAIGEIPMSDNDRIAAELMIDYVLNRMIDVIVGVATGEIDILGKIEVIADKCCGPKSRYKKK